MESILRPEERLVRSLRALYSRFGYRPYRMSKFEEYDLYAGNRSFLPSGSVITFTDTNGRLMALKPDVTLSIAKNLGGEGAAEKVYYDESVYRAPDSGLGFQEITQAGLEYLGTVDAYVQGEVLMLAARSLMEVTDEWVLDLSHMGYLCALVDELGLRGPERAELLRAVGSRSIQAIRAVCASAGAPAEPSERLAALYGCFARFPETLDFYGMYWHPFVLIAPALCAGLGWLFSRAGRASAALAPLRELGRASFEIFLFNAWVEVLGKRFGLAQGPVSWLLWSLGSVLAGLAYHAVVERCIKRAARGARRSE